jgi:hypothetical protein
MASPWSNASSPWRCSASAWHVATGDHGRARPAIQRGAGTPLALAAAEALLARAGRKIPPEDSLEGRAGKLD